MSYQEQEYYLKIPKKYFKQGLSPTELLIVSQVMEFSNNEKPCYVTDAQMAENFGISEKTISRTLKDLEKRNIITRDTKVINGKKTRTLMADTNNLSPREKRADTDKLSVTSSDSSYGQIDPSHTDNLSVPIQSNCPSPNGQIDLIKDKGKDNLKDNSPEITQQQLSLLANPQPMGEDEEWQYVANGNKTFKIKKGVSAQVR